MARFRLGLGSGGYGLLLGFVGVGALLAATLGPSVRRKLAPRVIYVLACLLVAGATLTLACHPQRPARRNRTGGGRDRMMAERIGATTTEVPGSHAIYVSQPGAVARLITGAARSPLAAASMA